MSDNRRSANRYPITLDVSLVIDGTIHQSTIENLSLGGALISFDERLGTGKRVRLSFRLPQYEEIIEIGATVRWSGELSVGVQFDGLRAKEVWALNKFFEACDPE